MSYAIIGLATVLAAAALIVTYSVVRDGARREQAEQEAYLAYLREKKL